MGDLANLDILRSLAVLLVVASHLLLYSHSEYLSSFWFIGLLGVFLFFTHTTLVLMMSQGRDPHPLRFYVRRIFRIYPLWLVVLLLSVLVHLPTSPAYAPDFRFYQAGTVELLENAALIFNLGKGANLIGASWSLPIEVQMYVVLPFIFFFLRAYRRVWPLLLIDLLAMATSRHLEPKIAGTLLFCTPLFLPGAMAYLLYERKQAKLPSWLFPIWLVGCVAFFDVWASSSKSSFRSGWIFALIIGLTLPFFRQVAWEPLCRVAHIIARYSYGIYLCHFPAIAVGLHYLRHYNLLVRSLGFLVTLTSLSVFFYHSLEKPMIGLGSKIAKMLERGPEPRFDERMLDLEPAP